MPWLLLYWQIASRERKYGPNGRRFQQPQWRGTGFVCYMHDMPSDMYVSFVCFFNRKGAGSCSDTLLPPPPPKSSQSFYMKGEPTCTSRIAVFKVPLSYLLAHIRYSCRLPSKFMNSCTGVWIKLGAWAWSTNDTNNDVSYSKVISTLFLLQHCGLHLGKYCSAHHNARGGGVPIRGY